jgi:glycosyltransferase involved in cell wall biosynthesis
MVHVTSAAEAESVKKVTANRNIVVIPPGIHAPALVTEEERRSLVNRIGALGGRRVLLFLSRLHRVKGLDLLIGAWGKLAMEFRDWKLVIAGPESDGSGGKAQTEIRNAGLSESVVFTGEASRLDCRVLLDLADVFVLPTRSENFGMVVAESLAAGRPVLTTTETPWGEIESIGCGWIVSPELEDVTEGLKCAMSLPTAQLRAMGETGRRWVTERFTWRSTAERMVESYSATVRADTK